LNLGDASHTTDILPAGAGPYYCTGGLYSLPANGVFRGALATAPPLKVETE